ncbi:Fe(3+)-citrate import system permease protein YfmD [Paenibacillus baekrokdamisoli]|uniref:Fe(3+)-citrate import system permease protein YfmD n=1 Tax=Paenibacillus baekrokdamisoli TaxID=1712516 RepID=A0A3G9JAZ2_9BACL|nr:iron ABC transporter permease [Paenibacillus baekrokdamisoli]MBB3067901.1 iron complex transport system permease protein [Paenibacillus baekrokdamisoli]BBH23051.1 Fe(3+)-citrate import system permease protein YfmD [Paenibacillus baekrokdamisoli]
MNQLQSGMRGQTKSAPYLFVGMLILVIILGSVGTFSGVKGLNWSNFSDLWNLDESNLLSYKVWEVRLPRVVLAIILGAGLAVAGCLLQGITRNPLSDPEIIGINQGACFFVVLSLVLFGLKGVTVTILIAGFVGAAVGGSLVLILSQRGAFTGTRLLLAGVSIALFMGSLTTGLLILQEDNLSDILYWMAGKLSGANWMDVKLSLLCVVPGTLLILFFAGSFNIFSLGEEIAMGLGQNVVRLRRFAFFILIFIVGGAVALAGPIGFVGLMVPHMMRSLVGTDYRIVFPLSALAGANLLLAADISGQWLLYPSDIPVGIITALLGTPFFLYLMRRKMGDG